MAVKTIGEYLQRYGAGYLVRWGIKAAADIIEGAVQTAIPRRYPKIDEDVQRIFTPAVTTEWSNTIRILGTKINPEAVSFTTDPITGRRFPNHHYKLLRHELRFYLLKEYGREGTDVKRPWDISRLQYLIVKPTVKNYARTKKIILRWLSENPPGIGINWVTPMEVAIRGINLVLYYHAFERFLQSDDEFRRTLLGAIRVHGEYLWKERDAEFGPIRGNHYNSDMLGLMVIGAFLKEKKWFEYGRNALEREMNIQVWDDGVSWEVSTNYHRLNTEIFTIAAIVADRMGTAFPKWWMERLYKMHLFLAWITKPNGLAPLIGDNDNSRIIDPELNRDRRDFRDVLDVGTVLFRDGKLKLRERPGPLLGILLGEDGIRRFNKIKKEKLEGVQHLRKSGYVVVKKEEFFFITRCGPMGLGGTGGHAHNDLLSFELYDGEDIIVDPGMPCYTSCPEKRNMYRSTRMHNTVVIDEFEQNTITGDLFKLFEEVEGQKISVKERNGIIEVLGEYRISKHGITHRRRFRIDLKQRIIEIEDEIKGHGKHTIRLLFITPHKREKKENNIINIGKYFIEFPTAWKANVSSISISHAYGEKIQGYKASIEKTTHLPTKIKVLLAKH